MPENPPQLTKKTSNCIQYIFQKSPACHVSPAKLEPELWVEPLAWKSKLGCQARKEPSSHFQSSLFGGYLSSTPNWQRFGRGPQKNRATQQMQQRTKGVWIHKPSTKLRLRSCTGWQQIQGVSPVGPSREAPAVKR